jgi:hypothetical protein
VIAKRSALNPVAGFTLTAGGHEWAYRRSEVSEGAAEQGTPDVLLLHGLGSSGYRCARGNASFCFCLILHFGGFLHV